MNESKGPAEALYTLLQEKRNPYLERARLCSRYTIPHLVPPEGSTGSTDLYKPFQAIGARGVNNLASKFGLTLLPPTRRMFRLILDDEVRKTIPEDQLSEFEAALVEMESHIEREMETLGVRVRSFDAFRHLIVSGNVLMFVDKTGIRYYPLAQYVVRRNADGSLRELVLKEEVSWDDLPEAVRQQIELQPSQEGETRPHEKRHGLYTYVYQDGSGYREYQEVRGIRVPDSDGSYTAETNPWRALRWGVKDGEDYSRSYCDEYIGDLIACESLSRSIIRSAAVAAKTVFLVNPNGMTLPQDLEKAQEGEFVPGVEGDVTTLGIEKSHDLQVASAVLDEINQRLSFAFLLNSAVRRQGERVTAEEIRYMASELEDALGGVYSVMSLEFQLPLVKIVMASMTRLGSLPSLPKNTVRPTIITGIDALGRSHEAARLEVFAAKLGTIFGPEAVAQTLDFQEYAARLAAALDLNPKNLVKTPEQIAQAQRASMQQQMVSELGPSAIKAISDNRIADKQSAAVNQTA